MKAEQPQYEFCIRNWRDTSQYEFYVLKQKPQQQQQQQQQHTETRGMFQYHHQACQVVAMQVSVSALTYFSPN